MPVITEAPDSLFEIWRKIPPEEKIELMAKAQSRGLAATLVLLVITGSMAAGLRIPWLFWGAFLAIPFVFQFAAAKAWRDIKPRLMLEYLAARSAARRYAYGAHAKDLSVSLLFRGRLQPEFDEEEQQEALEAKIANKEVVDVWVALFPDTVVMISECPGGAKLEFAQTIGERLDVAAFGFDDDGERRRVTLTVDNKKGDRFTWSLTSAYPAALLAFERKIKGFMEELRLQAERDRLAYRELFSTASESSLSD